jgi:hypothetical protein
MYCRFPNPVPSQIRVPQWALLDVTVCCQVFLLRYRDHNPLQNENLWNATKSYSAGGEHRLPYPFFFPLSHNLFLNRLTRARSWRGCRPIRRVHAPRHISHYTPHAFTPREFKHGRNRGWRRRWCCSNLHRRCRDLFLSATTTFTSAVCRGSERRCIPAARR